MSIRLIFRGKAGFTLMELLIVVAIMSLLAGLGATGLQGIRGWMARQETLSLFHELENACRLYRMDHGKWPESLLPGEIDLNALSRGWRDDLGPYMERRLEDTDLKDGFGNTALFLVIDEDGDHWIPRESLESLPSSTLPDRVWARVAIYSLDGEDKLQMGNWEDENR